MYVAQQAGQASAGFMLDRYGHSFETITPTHVEWPEDLLWMPGEDPDVHNLCRKRGGRERKPAS